jgi:hypothetical protein
MKRILAALTGFMVAGAAMAANEVTVNVAFKVLDGSIDMLRAQNQQFTVTNATPNVSGGTVVITTNAAQAISLSPLAVPGWSWLRNVDATNVANVIEVGTIDASTNFFPFLRLKPAEYAVFRFAPGVAVYGQSVVVAGGGTATNASSRLERLAVDD